VLFPNARETALRLANGVAYERRVWRRHVGVFVFATLLLISTHLAARQRASIAAELDVESQALSVGRFLVALG
jgi:hypothetical protein